jgi:hypothetical protein
MKRHSVLLIAAAAIGVSLAGCGPHVTPQATFRTCQRAVARKDWKTSLDCLTPASQDRIVTGLLAALAAASVLDKDAAAALKKHGVDPQGLGLNFMAGALINLGNPREALAQGMRQTLATIADRPAFVADALSWLEQNNGQIADHLGKAADFELKDVDIDGDTATGTLSTPTLPKATSLRFKHAGGRWLIDLTAGW